MKFSYSLSVSENKAIKKSGFLYNSLRNIKIKVSSIIVVRVYLKKLHKKIKYDIVSVSQSLFS